MKTVAQARKNYASTKSRMLHRHDALGAAARRGLKTAGEPTKNVQHWFKIQHSPLHNLGVFAAKHYQAMDPIVMGTGVIKLLKETDPAYSFAMMGAGPSYKHLGFECIDNHLTNTIQLFNSGLHNANAEVFWHSAVPVVYATKSIHPDTEILLSYGLT